MWIRLAVPLSAIALIGTGCSLTTEDDGADDAAAGECGEVVLVTHDSFDLPKKVVKDFEEESGCSLTHSPAGDGQSGRADEVVHDEDLLGAGRETTEDSRSFHVREVIRRAVGLDRERSLTFHPDGGRTPDDSRERMNPMTASAGDRPAPFRVVFVCTGNICRSPMVEIL